MSTPNTITTTTTTAQVNEIKTKDKYLFQYVVAIAVTLIHFSCGVAFGWTSPGLARLLAPNSPIPITRDQSSWILVSNLIGTVTATVPAGWIMDRFGRKIALICAVIPLIIGWILIGLANNIIMIFIARVFDGLSLGTVYSALPMYLGEIASPKIRGSLTTLMTIMMKGGVLYVYSIGPYVQMSTMAWIAMAPPILFLITIIWLPESPYFLLSKGREKQAKISLQRLRGHKEVSTEFAQIEESVKKAAQNPTGTFGEIFSSTNRPSILITLVLGAIQMLCGGQVVVGYAELIFDKIHSDLRGSEATIVLGAVQLVSAVIGASLVDIVGRKPLLLLAGTGTALCTTTVGLYFHLDRNNIDVSHIGWIPVTAMMIFIICYNLGITTVPYVMLGEIFPSNLKALAAGMCTVSTSTIAFGCGKMFQTVSDNIGSDVAFWIFSGFTYLFIPFVWFVVPETKGKTLNVILDELNSRRLILTRTNRANIVQITATETTNDKTSDNKY